MSSANPKKMKTADRQVVLRKVIALLQKKYGRVRPKEHRDVLQTLLYAILLENTSDAAAESAQERLLSSFHDLNEIRVSSITEIESLLVDLPLADWKALRIREALQFTFEKYYSFDLDVLKRKTMDLAEKQLEKISYLSPFARNYVLQHCLGSHVVPLDDITREVVQWLGLAAVDADNKAAAEELKSVVRKQEAPLLCRLLRELATDPRYAGTFSLTAAAATNGQVDGASAAERLKAHLARPPRPARKTVKKARKRPPAASRAAKSQRTAPAEKVRKRVSKPKTEKDSRRIRSR